MNRPIKFRQYVDGKFEYWGFGLPGLGNGFASPMKLHLPSQQFTGLKTPDDNVEVWEGDILQHTSMRGPRGEPLRHVVIYEVRINRGDSGFNLPKPFHKFKVVGNIYQNGDLIDEK